MTTPHPARLQFVEAPGPRVPESLCQIVDEGLSRPQKALPCRYFYDAAGSRLFEQICRLPEYYLTRTEQGILQRYSGEVLEAAGRPVEIVELGSGSSFKTRLLLRAALDQQPELHYLPIDISSVFLRQSAEMLLAEYDRLRVTAIAGEYRDGIGLLPAAEAPRLFLFLGSNVGNFEQGDAAEFLTAVRGRMLEDDHLLVGIDLLKDRTVIHAAYNDSQGVTAEFNKNLLHRINHELGGDFHVAGFHHSAPFVESLSRIEMRLISDRAQVVRIRATDRAYRFEAGEYIHTENSHKYSLDAFAELCGRASLQVSHRWLDSREWFAVLMLRPV